jgi:chromosome segregation ATPase
LTVGRLRQEVSKLRAEQKKREEEYESRMSSSVSSLKSQCFDLERKVNNANSSLGEVRGTASALEAALKRKEREVMEKDDQLEELTKRFLQLESERDDLRNTLSHVTSDAEVHRRKSENMNDRIGSLSASLSSMMDQQADLMKTINSKESRAVEDASARRSKLQALMEMEDRMIASSKFGNDSTVSVAFEKQAKEMDAIAAVIAAIRQ